MTVSFSVLQIYVRQGIFLHVQFLKSELADES